MHAANSMRIFLTEIRGEQEVATHEFNQTTIKIGRDPEQCDVVFEQEKWLMVSRVHAEIRVEAEHCYLIDLSSRQGTFLDGQQLRGPTEVHVGARMQFGQSGPVLCLLDSRAEAPANVLDSQPAAQETPQPLSTAAPRHATPELILESGTAARGERHFVLTGETTVLGRDAAADVQVEADAPVVSRRHAQIRKQGDGKFLIVDLQSFNGTLINGQRITQPTLLNNGDLIQLSIGGPVLRFVETKQAPGAALVDSPPESLSALQSLPSLQMSERGDIGTRTIVSRPGVVGGARAVTKERVKVQLLLQCPFGGNGRISVGRAPDNDIRLDALLISNHHARFINTAEGVVVEDAGSTNGVYLNGTRVLGWRPVQPQDVVHIGPFVLTADPMIGVAVFDTRSQTRVDAVEITDVVRGDSRHETKLLDKISLAIEPNEFVGLLGPSGAGKSLLMNALNGMRQTSAGRVLINNLDLYQHIDSLKQAIGHVPQDDIIHRQLTAYRTLYYVARLRLSRDVPRAEIDQIIKEVLEVTGLTERRDITISQLSGGQRKRVSIAVELITKPSIIFLDEPTTGLDPATEERIMKLFRQIAESGRTVVLTTHAMENVHLFDKVALLMRGKLIFYGTPREALDFVGVNNFIELYNKLDQLLEDESTHLPALPTAATKSQKQEYEERCNGIAEQAAEKWRRLFIGTAIYQRNISTPLARIQQGRVVVPASHRQLGIIDSVRQWGTLVRRYSQVLLSDKLNLLILFGQGPIIALLTYLVVSKEDPRDFAYFVLALVPVWFGTSVAAREIVKERAIYVRERMVNLGLLPYIGSKLFSLSCIVSLQCLVLFGTLKILHFAGMMYLPGLLGGLPQLLIMILTGIVGIALGLFVSALVRTSEIATSIVPLLLIPQILLCGLVGVPQGAARIVGASMPATWSFDGMKQLSTLDTLRQEGSSALGENRGRGLYKYTEEQNDLKLAQARQRIEEQRQETERNLKEYERKVKEYLNANAGGRGVPTGSPPPIPILKPAPSVPDVEKIRDDVSNYVSFKHPWGSIAMDPAMLLIMFCALLAMTVIALRTKDTG